MKIQIKRLRNAHLRANYYRLQSELGRKPSLKEVWGTGSLRLSIALTMQKRYGAINPIVAMDDFFDYNGKFMLMFQYLDTNKTKRMIAPYRLLHSPKFSKKYLRNRN